MALSSSLKRHSRRSREGQKAGRSNFAALLADVKGRIQSAQTRAVLAVNSELVRLYWDIGRIIDDRQASEGWGAAVVPRLAMELKNELPDLKGFSERNIKLMLAFYREYPDTGRSPEKVQPPVAQMHSAAFWAVPWAHHVIIVQKVKDLATRRWYMEQALANGWTRNVLALQIGARAHTRHGGAVSNFTVALPAPQSDLAQQTLKDPYSCVRHLRRQHNDDECNETVTEVPLVHTTLTSDSQRVRSQRTRRSHAV
jgi:predicted nuclease of restriction endonuclease-like (RecB) superfamily